MLSIFKITMVIILSHFISADGCNKKSNNCKEVACTEMFASVTISVENTSGNVVTLDEIYTIRVKTAEKIRLQHDIAITRRYTILDDNYQAKIANSSEQFQFIGMKNGVKVVDELFIIGADCCHINKIAGKDKVIVN